MMLKKTKRRRKDGNYRACREKMYPLPNYMKKIKGAKYILKKRVRRNK